MLKLEGLNKENGKHILLNNINLEIEENQFIVFWGTSGSGKTALLRIISGLEFANSGKIILKGINITNLPANKRNINTIFHNFSLFEHLDVYNNIGFGLQFKDLTEQERRNLINEAIDLFELRDYWQENVRRLDKMLKYKVSLARALINNPDLLLIDDILRHFNSKEKMAIRYELKSLQRKLGKIFIYITSDIESAFSLADKVGIMQNGVLHQFNSPQNIYEHPKTFFVADFNGNVNYFYAKIIKNIDNAFEVELDGRNIINVLKKEELETGRELFYAINAERINLSKEWLNDTNFMSLRGKVVHKYYNTEWTYYYVELEYKKIIMAGMLNYLYLSTGGEAIRFEIGEIVNVSWNIVAGNLVYA